MRRLACLLAVVPVAACGARSGPEPVVSPIGKVYELGSPPRETRRSQTATLYLRQDRYDRALELALEGISADSTNPVHFFLAGAAYARLARYDEADRMFTDAERLYPAYELDIEPERSAAWAAAFNEGLESYGRGEVEHTIGVWQSATRLSDLSPEAHRNLATVLTLEGSYDEAIDVYLAALAGLAKRPATRLLSVEELRSREQDALGIEAELGRLYLLTDEFAAAEPLIRRQLESEPGNVQLLGDLAATLVGLGRDEEAGRIYGSLLSEEGLAATQLFNLGVALFRSGDFERAARAFARLTDIQPRSRDAWYNYANSLFAAEAWPSLVDVGTRLVELDPLNENARLITARAQLEGGDREAARGSLQATEAAPVFLDELQLRRSGGETTVSGALTGNAAPAGASLHLRFTFYGESGAPVASEDVHVSAPAAGDRVGFEVSTSAQAGAYSYELLG